MSASPRRRFGGVGPASLASVLAMTLSTGCGGGQAGATGASSHAAATKVPVPGSTQSAPPAAVGRVLRRFSGSGNTLLGTIVVGSPEVLVWSAQDPAVQVFTANRFVLVSSHSRRGSIRLSGGTYRGVRVASRDGWSIELRVR